MSIEERQSLVHEATQLLEAGQQLLQTTHDRVLIDRITVATGYLKLLQFRPDRAEFAERLRKALDDLRLSSAQSAG
jgi:hypothetical protein